jgi:endo-1,3(4)-beta-glucanase
VAAANRRLRAAVALCAVVALSGCVAAGTPVRDGAGTSGDEVFPDRVIAPLVAAVPERTVTALPQARLADGLLPPTNTWFSGLVFGEQPMAVFPLPLSFALTGGGFALGLPVVSTTSKNIAGGFVPAIEADVGADRQVVTGYDAASVTITQYDGDTELGHTVIAQGSPFVSFTAAAAVRLPTEFGAGDGTVTTTVGDTAYGLVTGGSVAGGVLSLEAGQTATWFAVPEDGDLDVVAEAAEHPVTGSSLAYAVADGRATTTISYETADGAPTLIAAMPHQSASLGDAGVASYPSIYGTMRVVTATALSWSVDALDAGGTLDLSTLDSEEKTRLAEQVRADWATTPAFPSDTYFGGKALARAANLWSIATQVGADDAAAGLRALVVDELDTWMRPDGCAQSTTRCFVYDAESRGVVGIDPSFGSDEFNDHHFHYGYFLYAAGLLAADDPELAGSWAPVMDLLAADLATTEADDSTLFPVRRTFDGYAGHSWASGTSPFADGNNQESSSEAVNAWNGLALWAAASGQESLATEATWMLSAEAASASAYYTDFDEADPVYDGYDHSVVSLNWGGKRDWATWFSPEPSAMLGIVLLPLTGVSEYLAGDPERIRASLAEAAPRGYDVLFGDTLLMYSALAGPEDAAAALEAAGALPEDRIDQGNSRSWLLAWLMVHAAG